MDEKTDSHDLLEVMETSEDENRDVAITWRNKGEIFWFHAHAFRHTVGTRMINNGVPQHIVQKFLGHESPEMTARYAHIFDETLKKEFIKIFNGFKKISMHKHFLMAIVVYQ